MNQVEAQRLAAAVHALRPDWPIASLRTLITKKLLAYAWRDAALALAFVATDADTRTPARVLESGPWWEATRVANAEPIPLPPQYDSQGANRARADRMPSEDATRQITAARKAIHAGRAE